MFLKSALVVAALFVAELALYIAAASRFNLLVVSLVCIGLSVLGVQFLLKQAPGLVARTVNEVAEGANTRLAEHLGASVAGGNPGSTSRSQTVNEATVAGRVVKVFAAGLLAFPGFLTGAVGLLLFVGPVRGVVASTLGTRLSSLLPAGALGGHSTVRRNVNDFGANDAGVNDILDVTFTMKDPSPASPSAHADGGDASTRELPTHGT